MSAVTTMLVPAGVEETCSSVRRVAGFSPRPIPGPPAGVDPIALIVHKAELALPIKMAAPAYAEHGEVRPIEASERCGDTTFAGQRENSSAVNLFRETFDAAKMLKRRGARHSSTGHHQHSGCRATSGRDL
jgi:hypothetical protein